MSESPPPANQRLTVFFAAVAAALVMGGVVAFAMREKKAEEARTASARISPYGSSSPYYPGPEGTPPPTGEAMPTGCEPDFKNPPKMAFEIENAMLDFGPMRQAESRQVEVVFRNDGHGPLCVKRVEGSCGCVKASLLSEARKYEPGESGSIQVVMNTTGFEGTIKKRVTVYTNDPASPLQSFEVRAEVALGVVVTVHRLDFGRLVKGEEGVARARLRSPKDASDWTVSEVTGRQSWRGRPVEYTFEVQEVEDPAHRILEIVVRRPAMSEYGTFHDTIALRTTHPDRPEILLPSYLEVVAPVHPVPARAVFGFVPPSRPVRIRLMPSTEAVRFRVTGTRWETASGAPGRGDLFRATVGEGQAGETWLLLEYSGGSEDPGPLEATLVVTLDHPEVPEIRIPVHATVQAPKR